MLEEGAWGAADAGPIVRKVMEAWIAAQGGAVPPSKTPETGVASASSAPEEPEDTPVATPADMPAGLPADPSSTASPEDGGNR